MKPLFGGREGEAAGMPDERSEENGEVAEKSRRKAHRKTGCQSSTVLLSAWAPRVRKSAGKSS